MRRWRQRRSGSCATASNAVARDPARYPLRRPGVHAFGARRSRHDRTGRPRPPSARRSTLYTSIATPIIPGRAGRGGQHPRRSNRQARPPSVPERQRVAAAPARLARAEVYLDDMAQPVACPVYDREQLGPGATISGPALVQEHGTTTVMFPGDTCTVAALGRARSFGLGERKCLIRHWTRLRSRSSAMRCRRLPTRWPPTCSARPTT